MLLFGKKNAPIIVPANAPPLEAYDEQGEYRRTLDRRLNVITKAPAPKYKGMIPIIIPERLALKIAMTDESGTITRMLEIVIQAHEFDEVFSLLNGQSVKCFVVSVRPDGNVSTEMEVQRFESMSPMLTTIEKVEINLRD
jgi:hypothetical protein